MLITTTIIMLYYYIDWRCFIVIEDKDSIYYIRENEDQAYELAKNVPLLNLEFARGIRVREATQSDKN